LATKFERRRAKVESKIQLAQVAAGRRGSPKSEAKATVPGAAQMVCITGAGPEPGPGMK
jgi:hypothetical protein